MQITRRALITGIDGFTGQYLRAELVSCGWEVFGTGIGNTGNDARTRHLDLADACGIAAWVSEIQPDAVVHLAGVAFVGHDSPDAFYEVNLIGTRHLLDGIAQLSKVPDCVLIASSANVYGNSAEGVLTETQAPSPANDYAVSKLAMEHMARLWLDRLPIVIARPFNYTGIGQNVSFLVPKIVAHFRCRIRQIELGNLDVWRDFSDVRAVVHAYRRLLETCPAGETVNVCSGRTHSLREVLAMAESITGHVMAVRVNPAFVRPNEVKSLCGDPAKLVSLIGSWEMPPLLQTLRWMLAEGEPCA